MSTKQCVRCEKVLPLSEFYSVHNGRNKDTSCKSCRNKRTKQWQHDHPEKVKESRRRNNEKYRRGYDLKYKYGLNEERFDSILIAQEGVCACCFGPPSHKNGWCVDHNHVSGQVRSILCNDCNLMLGHAHDNVERLRQAINYLERFD